LYSMRSDVMVFWVFFSSGSRHTSFSRDWSSDVCSSDLNTPYGDGHSGSVALPSAPTAGNLLLLHVGRSNDESAPASAPTMGSGKGFTQLFNQTEPYNSGGLWYRVADGTESPTVSVADLGQQVGAYTAFLLELSPADGEPTVDPEPVDTAGFFRLF